MSEQNNSNPSVNFAFTRQQLGEMLVHSVARSHGLKICMQIFGKADPTLMRLLDVNVGWRDDEEEPVMTISFSKNPEYANAVPFPVEYRENNDDVPSLDDSPEDDDPEPMVM